MLNRLQAVFASFQKHNVKYLVIGGIASVLYGVPRATFDLDILIDPTPDNVQQLLDALADAGFGTALLTTQEEILANGSPSLKIESASTSRRAHPGLLSIQPGSAE